METIKRVRKPNDREVVALAQFRTGAGPMDDRAKNPKRRRMQDRLEESKARSEGVAEEKE